MTDIGELRGWWEATSTADFDATVPKLQAYSSIDLKIMGYVMKQANMKGGQEAATMWYALGKIARAIGAYGEGELPSLDTLHDVTVYSMMARRIRAKGGWPE
jgi:hypothetical protein